MSKSNMPTVCRGINGNGEIVLVLKKALLAYSLVMMRQCI